MRSFGKTMREALPLAGERRRTLAAELREQRVVLGKLALPLRAIHSHDLVEARIVEGRARPVEVRVVGNQSDRAVTRMGAARATLDDPLQHPHVLAEARPC